MRKELLEFLYKALWFTFENVVILVVVLGAIFVIGMFFNLLLYLF